MADITKMLKVSPYVHMISLDFSKAFDTVRHTTHLDKLALLPLSDFVWLVNYFIGHSHCTRFKNTLSGLANINASVIQGSALGPAAFIVAASDCL